jgi:signal transduction histidine kinase
MAPARHLLERLRHDQSKADAVLAVVLAALAQLEIWTSAGQGAPRGVLAAGALVSLGALAWRRRAPVVSALVALSAVAVVSSPWHIEGLWIIAALAVPLYSVSLYGDLRGALLCAAIALAVDVVVTAQEDNESAGQFLGNYAFVAALVVGVPWAAGRAVRSRQLRAMALEDRNVALVRESAERERAAVAEERLRIARELHDVVGHSLGVIVVQAGAERATVVNAPRSTLDTLATIERAGREALAEMRRLLDMMRRDDEEVALAPQPSLAHVETLVENVRVAGLPVELHVEGEPVRLPPGVDLSAYRIVQEALTNALKHAGPARVRVTVRYAEHGLELEVVDDGVGDGGAGESGHGVVGMRERVALYGGSLRTGAQPGGGYVVRVRLPFDAGAR